MPQFLADLQRNLKGIWSRLDGGQRLIVAAVVMAAVVGFGAIVWFAGQPNYVTVYQAKSGTDLTEAKRALSQIGVPFQSDESGRGLLVERARYNDARSAIVGAGLDAAEDRTAIGGTMIEDAETKRFRLDAASRAQAEQAISTLEGVASATVVATRPRRSSFVSADRDVRPSAAVSLRLRPGASFEAIARSAASIASSQLMVPMENVDVVNAANSQHWRYDPDRAAGGGTSDFLVQQRNMGDDRSRMAQEALDAIYPGKTRVTVTIDLDPQWEIRSEKVLPSSPVALTDKTTKDTSVSHEPTRGAAGDPSATANANAAPGGETNKTGKETRERTFLADVGERRVGKLAPEIRRMSVALLYDPSLEQQQNFKKEDLESVVKAIVGFRDGQDAISTYAGAFVAPEPIAEVTGPSLVDRAVDWAPAVGQVVGVLLVVMFLKGLLKAPAKKTSVAAAGAGGGAAKMSTEEEERNLPVEEQQKRMRREIERAIEADPAALAKLLESWLAEQRA